MNMQFLFAVLLLAAVALFGYQASKSQYREGMFDGYYKPAQTNFEPMTNSTLAGDKPAPVNADALSAAGHEALAATVLGHSQAVAPMDLLPKNVNKDWLKDSKIESLAMPNIATPDFKFGMNTIGQSNKNPNLQIRPDPPIRRDIDTGPFNQSIIEKDRPFKSQLAIH